MTLSRIVLRLARNPGARHAEPDDHRGYTIVAPLDGEGHLDVAAFEKHRSECHVRRFAPDEDPIEGRLTRHGGAWVIKYPTDDESEEPLFRLKDHIFTLGAYVSITDELGELLAYKVTEVTRLQPKAA